MNSRLEKIVSLCKRRGLIYQSSEIYGGIASCFDYGPLGVLLKNNLKEAWWRKMVQERDDIVGLDSSILMHPKTWEASGHLDSFVDLLVECKNCHKRFKKDEVKKKCPECGGELTQPRSFNLLMKTYLGPVEEKAGVVYLRPETCQGIYLDFKNVLSATRKKIPFGIAQIGKAFRNEITPGNFTFRTREFEQMEMQYFVAPKEAEKWFDYWVDERMKWYEELGIKKKNLRFKLHKKEDLPHYARKGGDIEYKMPDGFREIEGIHNRGDWDLKRHSEFSGKDLSYFGEIPYVIETSGGVDRAILTFLIDSYEEIPAGREKEERKEKEREGRPEAILHLHPFLAPIKCAVFPLVNKEKLPKIAKEIYEELKKYWFVQYDEVGSIGRRYRRQDEIGTPYCLTVDFQTQKDQTVTIRDRETMKQERVKIKELKEVIKWGQSP